MDKKNINHPLTEKDINNEIKYHDKDYLLKSKIFFIYDSDIKDFNSKYTLKDLKNYINTKYSNQDFDYELLIDKTPIKNLPDNTLILELLNKSNTNIIKLKTYKNSFDVLKQLNNYEKYLTENILLKDEEIKLIGVEYKKLTDDLNSIKNI